MRVGSIGLVATAVALSRFNPYNVEPPVAPAALTITSVSAGGGESCAIDSTGAAGEVYCWRSNFYGQLGVGGEGQRDPQNVPVRVRTA